jgi:hypothetical protein
MGSKELAKKARSCLMIAAHGYLAGASHAGL